MPDIVLDHVEGGSTRLRAYEARPAGNGPWPGVVAIHEAFGLNDVLRRQADRLAAAGYLTLGPDLFSDGGTGRCIVSTMRSLFTGHGKAFVDIETARQRLLADKNCTGKVGIIGFCMGGGFALVTADTGFDAAAPNYGVVPRHPREALAGACPIVASYGGKDVSLRGAAGKLRTVLDDIGVINDVREYPTAGHSFLNDVDLGPAFTHGLQRVLRIGPDPVAAADAWTRIDRFFANHLS